ncbi:MAG: DUF5688 family protein [Clostridia bacterium]|nr:DUF5688 family protein [Clostridia bacterium]
MNNNMNLREFAEYIRENIKDALHPSYRDASVEIKDVEKLNESYTSLIVRRPGEEVVPSIDLNAEYTRYSYGTSIDVIMWEIADIIEEATPDFDISIMNDYEKIKDKLFVRLSNEKMNEDLMDKVPHAQKLDMILTYHIALSQSADRTTSVMITNGLMENFGVSAARLHVDAVKNSMAKNPMTVMSMEDALREAFRKDLISQGAPKEDIDHILDVEFPSRDPSGLTVISNTDKQNGASVLFYHEALDQIAEKLGENFYVLPSSIHELLAVPESSGMTSVQLDNMVREVNAAEVKKEEVLSDHCYHYDAKEKLLEHGSQFEDRIRRQALEKNAAER